MRYYDPSLLPLRGPGIYTVGIDVYGRFFWQYVQLGGLPRRLAHFQRSRRVRFVGLLTQGPGVVLPPAYLSYGLPSSYWNLRLLQQQGWPRPQAGVPLPDPFRGLRLGESLLGQAGGLPVNPLRGLLPGTLRLAGSNSSSSQFNFAGFQQNIPQQPAKPGSVEGSTSKTKDTKSGGSKLKGSSRSFKGPADPATSPVGSGHQKPSPSPSGSRKSSDTKSVSKDKSGEKLNSSKNAKIASLKMKESSSGGKNNSQKVSPLPGKENSKPSVIGSDSYHPSDYPRPSQESPPPPSTAKVQDTVVLSSTEIHKIKLSKKKSNK